MRLSAGYRGALLVLAGTILYSLGGAGVKLCDGFGPWQLSGIRSLIAAGAVLVLVRESRRAWTPGILLIGACLGMTTTLFVWSTKTTTAANAILLQSTAPLWIMLFSPFLLKERLGWHDAVSGLAFLVGVVLISLGPTQATELSPDPVKGNWIALACGMSFAFMMIGLRAMAGRGAEAPIVCGNVLAAAIAFGVLLGSNGWQAGKPLDWLVVVGLGVFQLAGGSILYTHGLRYITAVRASLIGLLEPVLNPLFVMLIVPERPGSWSIVGGAIILLATGYQVVVRPAEKEP